MIAFVDIMVTPQSVEFVGCASLLQEGSGRTTVKVI